MKRFSPTQKRSAARPYFPRPSAGLPATAFLGVVRRNTVAIWLLCVALVLIGISGCHRHAAGSAENSSTQGLVLRLGYGKGATFEIIRRHGHLLQRLAEKGVTVQWLQFPMGPQMMEAIGTGSLDLGSCASTPPIFAQAAGVNFVYVAASPPGKSSGGILVPKNSPLKTVADLKGKTVALQPGSIWQYDLAQILLQNGLKYTDVKIAKMPPADATAAFTSGAVDAWIQGEPYVTLAKTKLGAHFLVDCSTVGKTAGFTLGYRDTVLKHPDLIRIVLEELRNAADWTRAHPAEAAQITADTAGLDTATQTRLNRSGNGTRYLPVDAALTADQQKQADFFYNLGVLPKKINVADDVLTPEQYAAILPAPRAKKATTDAF